MDGYIEWSTEEYYRGISERDETVIQATTWVGFANILNEMGQTQVVKYNLISHT